MFILVALQNIRNNLKCVQPLLCCLFICVHKQEEQIAAALLAVKILRAMSEQSWNTADKTELSEFIA